MRHLKEKEEKKKKWSKALNKRGCSFSLHASEIILQHTSDSFFFSFSLCSLAKRCFFFSLKRKKGIVQ